MSSTIVGVEFVLQQTPLSVTSAPPSEVILPPAIAEESVIEDTVVVVTMGIEGSNEGSVPFSQATINKVVVDRIRVMANNFEYIIFSISQWQNFQYKYVF
jgi:hypothetical protein